VEMLYNPDQMSDNEIKATFVARQPLVDKLVTMIRNQPEGAGVQHAVLVAPRGMGKTTVLLMVKLAMRDCGLSPSWLAIHFRKSFMVSAIFPTSGWRTVREVAREDKGLRSSQEC